MRTLSEIEDLYNSTLQHNLSALEGERKKVMVAYLTMFGFVALGVVFIVSADSDISSSIVPIVVLFAIAMIALVLIGGRMKKQYREKYKAKVVAEVVKLINPDWTYHPDGRIEKSDYTMSGLFRTFYDRYEGDDYISGVLDKTEFQSSELHTQYKTTSTDKDGKTQEHWHTIFKGLFFHADFNKEFKGITYVVPERGEKSFAKAAAVELVQLENPVFEDKFAAYSTDQIEARYIITPTVMEAMLAIREYCGDNVYFSFVHSRVYCAMSFRKNLFEPTLYRSGVNFDIVANMYQLFKINELIIQELNLNTRIWTKV